mgnify:FL=1
MGDPIFIDTNVFLRFFVADVEGFYQRAMGLFERAEKGEIRLVTSDMVIAEIVWVLESYYGFKKEEVRTVVETLLHSKGLKVINSDLIEKAIINYVDLDVDFIDAYNGALMKVKGYNEVVTFDEKHFQKLEGIRILTI